MLIICQWRRRVKRLVASQHVVSLKTQEKAKTLQMWVRRLRHVSPADGLFVVITLISAFLLTRGLVAQPGYTDAFYHFNAAARFASGQGLTDLTLWTYIGEPPSLPAPSHLYWMPLTSLVAAFGMIATGQPGSVAAAQWPFTLLFAATALVGYGLGGRLGGSRRHAWLAGWLTLFSGFFTRYWGAIDTVAPYALVGSLGLAALGAGVTRLERGERPVWPLMIGAGLCAGLAHLTRADGVLLLLIGWVTLGWYRNKKSLRSVLFSGFVFTLTYGIIMFPWWIRNSSLVGVPLPVGGTQGIWFTDYNELFNYPPDANPARLFADGIGLFLRTRWEAFVNNLGTFVAVEGLIVLTPLMLVGLWQRRGLPFLRAFWLYALGLHVAMTLVFPFPGYRGGLLHSAAALVPWWAALGVVGLDDVIAWVAARRRRWRVVTARRVFGAALALFALWLSLSVGLAGRVLPGTPARYTALDRALPADARVMINDPSQLYYFTGRGGVVLPNETPDVIPEIARRYKVRFLLLEGPAATPPPLWSLYDRLPSFLTPVVVEGLDVQLYEIRY